MADLKRFTLYGNEMQASGTGTRQWAHMGCEAAKGLQAGSHTTRRRPAQGQPCIAGNPNSLGRSDGQFTAELERPRCAALIVRRWERRGAANGGVPVS